MILMQSMRMNTHYAVHYFPKLVMCENSHETYNIGFANLD